MAFQKLHTVTGMAVIHANETEIPAGMQSVEISLYIKVESIQGSKKNIKIDVSFTHDKTQFQKTYLFQPSLDGPNFIKQAYLYLKTLPEFSDATDC